MRRQLAALLVGAFMVPQLVSGQTITPGSRVRVSHPGEGTRIGTVVELTADTLEVRFVGRSDPAHLPLEQVTRLDISRGKHRRTLALTGTGFLLGAVVGAGVGAAANSECQPGSICVGAAGGALVGGGLVGAIGGVLGLLAGITPSERWEQVPLERRRIGIVAPTRSHGGGIGIALAF